MLKFKKYNDPGHGWLAVSRKFLISLGIYNEISRYSYQKGKTVYLEADCDMSLFIQKMKEKNIEFSIEEKHTNKNSPIRSYESFTKQVIIHQLKPNFCFDLVDKITQLPIYFAQQDQEHFLMAAMLGFSSGLDDTEIINSCAEAYDFLSENDNKEFTL